MILLRFIPILSPPFSPGGGPSVVVKRIKRDFDPDEPNANKLVDLDS